MCESCGLRSKIKRLGGVNTDHPILLTAFRNTSAELLLKGTENDRLLLLPNDKIGDSDKLIACISNERFDYIISVGQKPNIQNQIHLETTAGKGNLRISTGFDCERLVKLFVRNGIPAKLSHHAGTSYCNELYLNGLRYISETDSNTKMVLVHIPFVKKINDFESFRRKFLLAVAEVRRQE